MPLCSMIVAATPSSGEHAPAPAASPHPSVRSALRAPIPPRSKKLPKRCGRGSEFAVPSSKIRGRARRLRPGVPPEEGSRLKNLVNVDDLTTVRVITRVHPAGVDACATEDRVVGIAIIGVKEIGASVTIEYIEVIGVCRGVDEVPTLIAVDLVPEPITHTLEDRVLLRGPVAGYGRTLDFGGHGHRGEHHHHKGH